MDDVILGTVAKLIIPFIQAFGVYVVLHGHLSPGGAFAGGAIIASAFILGTMTFGRDKVAGRPWGAAGRVFESIGGFVFLAAGFVGIVVGTGFLSNASTGVSLGDAGRLASAGLVPVIGLGLGLKVMATLVTLFRGLAGGYDDEV